jgi:hypothetical protein
VSRDKSIVVRRGTTRTPWMHSLGMIGGTPFTEHSSMLLCTALHFDARPTLAQQFQAELKRHLQHTSWWAATMMSKQTWPEIYGHLDGVVPCSIGKRPVFSDPSGRRVPLEHQPSN